jgi:hypothetical protein
MSASHGAPPARFRDLLGRHVRVMVAEHVMHGERTLNDVRFELEGGDGLTVRGAADGWGLDVRPDLPTTGDLGPYGHIELVAATLRGSPLAGTIGWIERIRLADAEEPIGIRFALGATVLHLYNWGDQLHMREEPPPEPVVALALDEVQYPSMRDEVRVAAEYLADLDYQRRVWRERLPPPDGENSYTWDLAVHVLFDDTTVARDARGAIGVVLRDEREADAIARLVEAIERAWTEAGGAEASEAELLATLGWREVVGAAAAASREMSRP